MTTISREPTHSERVPALVGQFKGGLAAPICLTWEWTYACNLSCAHCLSSAGRRDPDELATDEMRSELLDYAVINQVGVKFSTNGLRRDAERAQRLAATDYVDVQVSLDGASRQVNDAIRGHGSYDMALRAMENLAEAGFRDFKISVVMTRHNVPQLDELAALADRFGAQLRITRLRPSGRGAEVWHDLRPTDHQQREIYSWLVDHGDRVLTGDSFFHLNALGATSLPGLNLCGAGRVVCLIDPIGDVYACPFAIHDAFKAGTVRAPGGFAEVWRSAPLFARLRTETSGGACRSCSAYSSCQGGCMAAKFFTGLPLDGPDPECVKGHGASALRRLNPGGLPRPDKDHSHGGQSVPLGMPRTRVPAKLCDSSPLAVTA